MKKQKECQVFSCITCNSKNTTKQGISNWHDNTGVYYLICNDCGREWNHRWGLKNTTVVKYFQTGIKKHI